MADWLQSLPPLLGEFVIPFMLLGLAISLVAAGLKKDKPAAILGETGRLYLILLAGFVVFCGALFVLGDPHLLFR